MPAHVPSASTRRERATVTPLLDLDTHETAAGQGARSSAQDRNEMRGIAVQNPRDAGIRWAEFLRNRHRNSGTAKKVLREFAAAGFEVDERTVDYWLAGNLPSTNRHLLAAIAIYGAVSVIAIYDPGCEAAVARHTAEAAALLRDLAGRLPS
jgi:hypothetical protein